MITVVIPYFQRSPGILARALASIAAQQHCPQPLTVVVVDDGSPAPAQAELASFQAGFKASSPLSSQEPGTPTPLVIELIEQDNAGPGAARNTGLNQVPACTRWVAFLDSDDEWMPTHLQRATHALHSGADCYFADHYQLEQSTSAFARAGRIRPEQHPLLAQDMELHQLHHYQGDMLDQILSGNVIGTSTVVYDFQKFHRLRFEASFQNAGEDYLFWMMLAQQGARFAFSSQVEARYGKGINIYAGSGWGTEQHLLRIHNEIKFRKMTRQRFDLSAPQQAQIRRKLRELRHDFAQDLLHRLAHLKKTSPHLLLSHLALDPWSFMHLPYALTQHLSKRL